MNLLRLSLARVGSQILPEPILYKYLSGTYLRLMFPVSPEVIENGTVVSVVALYDVDNEQTLYAHPMHAGPNANPLLKHLDNPMATPKAQQGSDGDRATGRLLEHKRALWKRFCNERTALGDVEASRRWREGYYWSLQRLYFCNRCTPCKWGNPFFEGTDPQASGRETLIDLDRLTLPIPAVYAEIVDTVLQSEAWEIEAAYIQRGGWTVCETPWLLNDSNGDYIQLIFPTNAGILQAGSIVALSVVYHQPTSVVHHVQCLVAGSEPEIIFMNGKTALELSPPQTGKRGKDAVQRYSAWRERAWSQFWLDELEEGLEVASLCWLDAFWKALEQLFGGNHVSPRSLSSDSFRGTLMRASSTNQSVVSIAMGQHDPTCYGV